MTRTISMIAALLFSLSAYALPDRDQQIHSIAKTLKPISNEIWQQVAGDQTNQTYEVVSGDTLYDISGRLFGDTRYWPKIWSLNNGKLKNPHVIFPGNLIAFYPGSGTTLPSLGMQSQKKPVIQKKPKKRSTEWKNLPLQKWEQVSIQLPPEVDPDGFDRRNKMSFSQSSGFVLPAMTTTEQIAPLGLITGAKSQFRYLGIGDTLFIKSQPGLQIGQVYSISQEPTELVSDKLNRRGYSYVNLGSIQITDYRDGIYIAEILQQAYPILRGNILVPLISRVQEPNRVPGHEPLRGSLFIDRNLASTDETAQHKFVLVDRGARDGIQPGMVFRNYVYHDKMKNEKMISEDALREGDILIVHVSDQFSTGVVSYSINPMRDQADVVLLTGLEASDQGKTIQTLDNLNRVDPGADLNEQEKKDLEQLEGWDGEPLQEEVIEEGSEVPQPEPTEEIIEFETAPGESLDSQLDPSTPESTPPSGDALPPSSDIENLDEFELDDSFEE